MDMIASSNDSTTGTVSAKEPKHHPVGIIDRREIEFGAKVLARAIAASLSKVDAIGLPAIRPSGVLFCPKEGLIEVLYDPSERRQVVKVPAASLGAFLVADRLSIAARRHPLANPVLISVTLVAVLLRISDTPYKTYFDGAQFVHFLLGPATVALGVPLYKNLALVRRNLIPMAAVYVGLPARKLSPPRRRPAASVTYRERFGTSW